MSPKSIFSVFIFLSLTLTTVIAKAQPDQVVVSPASSADVADVLRLSGSFTAKQHAMLSPRLDGLVQNVSVDAGSRVSQGDVLIVLDPVLSKQEASRARAVLEQNQASRDEAARLVKEAEQLRQKQHISETELNSRKAALMQAEADLQAARVDVETAAENLRRHKLIAPFNGVIVQKMSEAGEWVNRGDNVLELVSLENLRLDIRAPQERFGDINQDTQVQIRPDTHPDVSIVGKISAIVPASDPTARAFLIRVTAENSDIDLFPGTSATAMLTLARTDKSRIRISRDALLKHPDGGYSVFVIEDEKTARRRDVDVLRHTGDTVLIRDGVSDGEPVVVRGNELLRDGDEVEVVEQ